AALPRGLGVMEWIEAARRLDHAGEQRRLRDVELADRPVEVRACTRGHAVRALAEEHEVEIDLEDLALGPLALDHACEQRLANLATRGALLADLDGQQVARDLLRDRRGA